MQGVYDYDRGISAVDVLMARCPNATLTVHPRGARHVIDPSHLLAATIGVYGEREARRMYGEVLPVPAERVRETPDGVAVPARRSSTRPPSSARSSASWRSSRRKSMSRISAACATFAAWRGTSSG